MIKRAGREASSAFRAVTCLEKRNGQEKTIKWLPFIRPDGDLVYFVDKRRGELIQYHMGGNYGKYEQVLRLCTLGPDCEAIPYVPCFSRSLALDTETC